MNDNVQRAYNAIAMLMPEDPHGLGGVENLSAMDRHMLRSTIWRCRVILGEYQLVKGDDLDALAYMAGYEDESK